MDLRSEANNIRKQYRSYQSYAGESVVWYEHSPLANAASAGSYYDDVYDEGAIGGGGKSFKTGITVPILMITESEDTKRAIPEGRQPVEIVNLVASVSDFRDAGIETVFEYKQHLNDMFLYDGRYFSVMSYRVRGRLRDDILVVVEGLEVYLNQEMPFDPGPTAYAVKNYPWPTKLPTI
jgi:hypothetical protein